MSESRARVSASVRSRPSVVRNAVANLLGQSAAALVGLLCVPVYLGIMGAEAIGLVGFSLGIQAIIRVLDFGLSSAVVRQLARLSGQPGRRYEVAAFFGTFERLFLAIAAALAVVTLALSPLAASYWLRAEQLPRQQVAWAVAAISLQAAVLFVSALYHGALMGMERQVTFNFIRVTEACLSQLGGILLLIAWAPRLELMFGWQLVVAVVFAVVYGRAARAALPAPPGPFRAEHVRAVWTYALGMAGITATGTVLVNMDKVLLGRWLRLESFGHYTLAFFAASLVGGLLVAPVFNALFPRACALVERGDGDGERELYHQAIQVLMVLVGPVSAVVWGFAPDILQLWIRDRGAVSAAQPILPLLVAGVVLNTVMVPAYMIQLAHGWTTLGLRLNIGLIVVFAPVLYLLTARNGLQGAALSFVLMQGSYLLIGLPLTHRRLLPGDLGDVVLRDVLPSLALCAAVAAALVLTRGAWQALAPPLRYAMLLGTWAALVAGTVALSARLRPIVRQLAGGGPDSLPA